MIEYYVIRCLIRYVLIGYYVRGCVDKVCVDRVYVLIGGVGGGGSTWLFGGRSGRIEGLGLGRRARIDRSWLAMQWGGGG